MKRLPVAPTAYWRLPAVVLYRDDLDTIVEAIIQAGLTLRLNDAEYDFDDFDDVLRVRGSKPSQLSIKGAIVGPTNITSYSSYVSIEIKIWGALDGIYINIPASARTDVLREIILEIFGRRRRWYTYILIRGLWSNIAAVSFAAAAGAAFLQQYQLATGLMYVALLAGPLSVLGIMTSRGWGSRVNLLHKHAASSFFSRNADKLIGGAIGAAVGAAVTVLIRYFIDGK